MIAVTAGVVAFWALFGLGLRSQVIIDGRPVPETSQRAAAARLAQDLQTDLYTMADLDRLLAMDPTEARIHVKDIQDAKNTFDAIAKRWDATNPADLPGPDWVAAVESERNAAALGAVAADTKLAVVLDYNTTRDAVAANQREAFVAETLRAGHMLASAAAAADVPVGAPAGARE